VQAGTETSVQLDFSVANTGSEDANLQGYNLPLSIPGLGTTLLLQDPANPNTSLVQGQLFGGATITPGIGDLVPNDVTFSVPGPIIPAGETRTLFGLNLKVASSAAPGVYTVTPLVNANFNVQGDLDLLNPPNRQDLHVSGFDISTATGAITVVPEPSAFLFLGLSIGLSAYFENKRFCKIT